MRRIRSRLTYANVMVTILAFVVLGGGTAIGAIVVSDNSQVAANTISGHKPPTGKHANIIGGSVNSTDLATGAVTQGKIGISAVTTGKLAGSSVNSAKILNGSVAGEDLNKNDVLQTLNFRSGSATADVGHQVSFYNDSEFQLTGGCVDLMGQATARIVLSNTPPHKAVLTVGETSGQVFSPNATLAETPPSSSSQARGASFSVLDLNAGAYLDGRVQAAFLDAVDSPTMTPQCVFTFNGSV